MPFANPGFQQCRVARGFFDDVADHPVHRLLGHEGEAVGHQVLHQACVHQAFGHGAVVDGGHQHATVDQLPGPAARRCAEVDAGHVAVQALVPLVTGDKVVPGFLQLEGRTAGRVTRELEARDAHGPHRRVVRLGQAHEHFAAALEGQQQARLARVVHQLAGVKQGFAQVHFEFLAEVGQFLAVVGVDHLQPQAAAHGEFAQVGEDHADAVGFRQVDKHPARPLPGEDQLGKALAVHEALGAVFFGADKFGAGAAGLGLGVAGNVQARGVLRDLGTDFAFKTRAAVHKKGVH